MTRVAVADLVPATPYKVQVRAVSDGEFSEWSESFAFTTSQNASIPVAPATVTWVVQGDGFFATWTEVTQDVAGGAAIIDSYELELTATPQVKTVVVPAQIGQSGNWSLDFQGNTALFGTPQPSISLRVRAVNNKGIKGNWSGSINASNPVPANVAGFSGVAGLNTIDLTWTANTDLDLDHYEIFTGTSSGFTPTSGNRIFSGNVTRFTYTSTTYSAQYFKIRAIDKFGQASASDTQAGPYTPTSPFVVDTTAPAIPTSLAGTITNNANGIGATAAMTWTMSSPPADLAGFNIRYRKVGATPYLYQSGIDSAARASTIILDTAYQNYEFQIQAYDYSGNQSAYSSTTTVTSPSNATPGTPTGLTSVAANNAITYSWTGVADTDIKNYEVTVSTSPTFASGNLTYLTGSSTTLTVSGLNYATTYYARVRANDTGGLSGSFTSTDTRATSAAPSGSDGLAPASSPTPTVAGALGALYVSWTAVSNADPVTYEVHVSTSSGFTPSGATKAAEVMGTNTYLDRDGAGAALAYGTTYFIKLIAKDVDGAASAGSQASGSISQIGVADVGANAITTSALAANAVTANKLSVVMGGGNLASNTNNGVTTGNSTQAGATLSTDGTTPGVWLGSTSTLKVNLATSAFSGFQKQNFTLLPNTTYTASAWVKLPSAAGTTPTGGIVCAISGAGVTSVPNSAPVTVTGVWTRLVNTFTTNATATPVNLVFDRVSSSGVSTEYFNIDGIQLELGDVPTAYSPRADEIMPGTIATNMLQANAVTANEISGTAFTGKTFTVGASGFIQSSNYVASTSGWRIGTTGIEMNDTGSAIKVDVLKAGTIGSSTGTIQIAAGASINMNGGYIKSNTNTGTTMATAVTSGSGFYLGNDGLFIGGGANGGQIKANALITDTLTSTTITLGAGGSIVGGSWTLNSSGLTIPNGGIQAAALSIQQGQNLVHPAYADFEWASSWYPGQIAYTAGSGVVVSTDFKYNTQSLQWTTSSTSNALDLSASQTTHNMTLNAGTTYIISVWAMVKTGATAVNLTAGIRHNISGPSNQTVSGTVVGSNTVAANSTWARYTWTVSTSASALGPAHLFFTHASTGAVVYLDAIQIEEKMSSSTTASSWTPPSSTTVDGGMVRTGSIQSNATTVVNGSTIPLWSIPTSGSATFANLSVRGSVVVGKALGDTADGAATTVSSANYVTGTSGWQIRSDGSAEFRQLDSDSINGDAIRAGTLTVDKLGGGSLDQKIMLDTNSSIVAIGAMGEAVGLGNYGFKVNGPQENPVTFRASSGTTRTLTTTNANTFDVGAKINVNIGNSSYDGTYAVLTSSGTTVTYTALTSLTESTTAVVNGILQGANGNLDDGPIYINFPTDGTQPNIISGILTADTITVTNGMSIRLSSQIEQGATLIINSVIQPPKAGPTISTGYDSTILAKPTSTATIIDMAFDPSGNLFVLWQTWSNAARVCQHSSTGAIVSTVWSDSSTNANYYGLVNGTISAANYWYILRSQTGGHKIYTYNSSWAAVGSAYSPVTANNPGIGWDYTNSRLMYAYTGGGLPGGQPFVIDYYTMTSGAPTAVASSTTTTYTPGPVLDQQYQEYFPTFLGRGDFDFGAASDRIVINVEDDPSYYVRTNTGTADSNKNWDRPSFPGRGGAWNTATSKFSEVSNTAVVSLMEGGDSYWTTTTNSDVRWVRYSYYKSTGTPVETSSSPATKVTLEKRQRINFTITAIPYGNGTGNVPDQARVYLLDSATDVYPTVTNYYLRATLNVGQTTGKINPNSITTGTLAPTTNGFAALSGNPGQIQSSTGNSYWKGDDTAQFYALVLQSGTDVNTNSGNTPALRIGPPTGGHLRIDGNEIQSMASDSSGDTGILILNQGGGNVTIAPAGLVTVNAGTTSGVGIQSNGASLRLSGQGANPADLYISGASNISTRLTHAAGGTALTFRSAWVAATTDTMNSLTPGSGNSATFHAADIHSWTGGVIMEDLAGSVSTATINSNGRIVRTSTQAMKKSIKKMTDEEAHSVLGLKSYTFQYKPEGGHAPDPRRYPGFLAEQGAEVGAELWVARHHEPVRDEDGNIKKFVRPSDGGKIVAFRTQEITVAHNVLIKELFEEIESLKSQIAELKT